METIASPAANSSPADTKPAHTGMFQGLAPRSKPARNRLVPSFLIGSIVGLVLMGGYLGVQHFVVQPAEERAAFKTVTESTSEELRGKSVDELVDLGSKVDRFGVDVPGMIYPSIDAGIRVEHALAAKQGRH